jgi:hypothetical protein
MGARGVGRLGQGLVSSVGACGADWLRKKRMQLGTTNGHAVGLASVGWFGSVDWLVD